MLSSTFVNEIYFDCVFNQIFLDWISCILHFWYHFVCKCTSFSSNKTTTTNYHGPACCNKCTDITIVNISLFALLFCTVLIQITRSAMSTTINYHHQVIVTDNIQLVVTSPMLSSSFTFDEDSSNMTTTVPPPLFPDIKQPVYLFVIYVLAYSIVFILALAGNSLVVSVVYRNTVMHNVTNYFIVNLAVADILVVLCCLPITLLGNLMSGKILLFYILGEYNYTLM